MRFTATQLKVSTSLRIPNSEFRILNFEFPPYTAALNPPLESQKEIQTGAPYSQNLQESWPRIALNVTDCPGCRVEGSGEALPV